ncbi:MAG: glycosyltransferase family 4 protein [Solirubrobacteraceae bacterium]|nr:glycosyltransferase family 4 protein [Solirubrobacteraceae bacterium]
MSPAKPALIVTNHVPPDRVGAFQALHARTPIELALYGGRSTHATEGVDDPGVPLRRIDQRQVHALAASGRHSAVLAGTTGRVALPAAWRGARRAGIPFVLWTALWAHPRTPAHLPGALLLRAIYRDADAVVTYGPHVSEFVRARGARRVFEAPQAVDVDFWSSPVQPVRPAGPDVFTVTFVGRAVREKGLWVLEEAWRESGLSTPLAALVLVGVEPGETLLGAGGAVTALGTQPPENVRNSLAGSDVLVVPSVATRRFREPWGLVVNEGMHASCAVIASDEVGAAAGGLVQHDQTGLVVPAGNPHALATALHRLHADAPLRARLAAAGHAAAAAYTFDAWADGMAQALAAAAVR